MKAYPFEEKRLLKWKPPFIVQPKFDGFRCRVVIINKISFLLSSEENIFFSVPHLNKLFDSMDLKEELDGELYNHEIYLEKGFEGISSICSRTINLHPDHNKMQFHMFDIINQQPQINRLLEVEKYKNISPLLKVSPFYICHSFDEILKVYDTIISNGYEGIIVREMNNFYIPKRSTSLMKFKAKAEDKYKIVGFEEEVSESGELKNSLGSFICESNDGNLFSVGTGFTEAQRKMFWKDKDNLIGKIAVVKYQHLTNKKVPRHSVFVEINN